MNTFKPDEPFWLEQGEDGDWVVIYGLRDRLMFGQEWTEQQAQAFADRLNEVRLRLAEVEA